MTGEFNTVTAIGLAKNKWSLKIKFIKFSHLLKYYTVKVHLSLSIIFFIYSLACVCICIHARERTNFAMEL